MPRLRTRRGGGYDDDGETSSSSKGKDEDEGSKPATRGSAKIKEAPEEDGLSSWLRDQHKSIDQTTVVVNGVLNLKDQKKTVKLDRKVVESLQNEISSAIKKLQELAEQLKKAVAEEEDEEQAQPEEVDEGAESDDTVIAPVLREGLEKKVEDKVLALATPDKDKQVSSGEDSDTTVPKKELRRRRLIKKEREETKEIDDLIEPSSVNSLETAAAAAGDDDERSAEEGDDDEGANSDDTMIPPKFTRGMNTLKKKDEKGTLIVRTALAGPPTFAAPASTKNNSEVDELLAPPTKKLPNGLDEEHMEVEEDEGAKSDESGDTVIPPTPLKKSNLMKKNEDMNGSVSATPEKKDASPAAAAPLEKANINPKKELQRQKLVEEDNADIDDLFLGPSSEAVDQMEEAGVNEEQMEEADLDAGAEFDDTVMTPVLEQTPTKDKGETETVEERVLATPEGDEPASSGNESDTVSKDKEVETRPLEKKDRKPITIRPLLHISDESSKMSLKVVEPMEDAINNAGSDSGDTVLTPMLKKSTSTTTPKKIEDVNVKVSATPDEKKESSADDSASATNPRKGLQRRRLVQKESKEMKELLGSSSDSDARSSVTTRSSRRRVKKQSPQEKKERKKSGDGNVSSASSSARRVVSSTDVEKPLDIKDDPKLKEGAAYVKVTKLDQKILKSLEEQNYIVLDGYSRMKKSSKRGMLKDSDSDDESSYDSDDTIKKLKLAVKQLTRTSLLTTATYRKKTKKVDGDNPKTKKAGRGRPKRKNENDQKHELLSTDEDDSDANLSSARGVKASLFRDDEKKLLEDSESEVEDLDGSGSDFERAKKNRKTRSQAQKGKEKEKDPGKKKKTYKSMNIRSSDSDDKDCERDLLGSDSEDSDTEKKKRKKKEKAKSALSDSDTDVEKDKSDKKKKKKEHEVVTLDSDDDSDRTIKQDSKKRKDDSSDTDSDFIQKKSKVTGARTKKRKKADSDSSIQSIHSDSSDSNDSDSDFKKKPSKGKRRRKDSDSDNKAKKRRRRIIANDSDDSEKKTEKDSDIEEVEPGENDGSPHKGRKNIRKIMSSKHIAKSTKEAEREEDERRKRLSEKQKLFNGIHKAPESDKVERLILDVDPDTNDPVLEVDQGIASKLKPHQAEGIKFMYNACFESIAMIKENKVPGGCILAHCMGLGKTLQSIAFLHALLTNEITGIKTALIICPLSTVTNWFNEFRKWTEDAATDLKLHQIYEAKRTNQDRANYLRKWMKKGGVGIIHYDMFVRLADPKKKQKIKESVRKVIEECLLDPGPDIVVCDEGHLLKNCKSQRALAVNLLRTRRRIVLTGTPLQNNLVEYHTMMNFVKPNLLGSLPEFTNRFVNPIQNGQHADSTDYDVKIMKRRAHVLHAKLEGCVQRCDYSILAPYLPPKYEYIINIKLSKKQEEVYKYYLEHVIGKVELIEKRKNLLKYYAELVKVWSHPIALTMRKSKKDDDEETSEDDNSLKDFICDDDSDVVSVASGEGSNSSNSNPAKSKGGGRRTRSKGLDPDAPKDLTEANVSAGGWWSAIFKSKEEMYDVNISGKLVVLQEILKTCEAIGDRVLVFSQFLTSLDIIEEFLADWDKEAQEKEKAEKRVMTFPLSEAINEDRWRKNIEYFRIDGGVKQSDRQKDCDKFNRKSTLSRAKLFLISTKAGGLGINLYGANRVVIFDASWNPSQDMQSIFRVYRFGQDKPCYIYRFIALGTMEQKILRRQITKLSLSSRVVDEHQIQRHFKFDDVNELYEYDEDESGSNTNVMAVPKDKLLADLILSMSDWIKGYEEFDSLLENRPDEGLSKEEKELAWAEYKVESQRQRQVGSFNNGMTQDMEVQTYMKVKSRIKGGYPSATDTQIETATQQSLQVIQKIRQLMLLQNGLPPEKSTEVEPIINPLKVWLQESVSDNAVRPVPDPNSPLLRPFPGEFYMNPKYTDFFPPQPNAVRPPMVRFRGPRSQLQPTPSLRSIHSSFAHAANNLPNINYNPSIIQHQQQLRQQLIQQQQQRNFNANRLSSLNRDPLQ